MAEAPAEDPVPDYSQTKEAEKLKNEFINYLVSPHLWHGKFPGGGSDAFVKWKEEQEAIRPKLISDFKKEATEWSRKSTTYYTKDGPFILFEKPSIKRLMGQWLVQKTMIKQHFDELSTKQKSAVYELPLGVIDKGGITHESLFIPESTAYVIADFVWLEAIAKTDVNTFMFLYNLFQWNSDIHSHENELADRR
eukprot:664124_1